jgi:hypothetical protein
VFLAQHILAAGHHPEIMWALQKQLVQDRLRKEPESVRLNSAFYTQRCKRRCKKDSGLKAFDLGHISDLSDRGEAARTPFPLRFPCSPSRRIVSLTEMNAQKSSEECIFFLLCKEAPKYFEEMEQHLLHAIILTAGSTNQLVHSILTEVSVIRNVLEACFALQMREI